jgi:hypothetical protein
VAAEAEAAEHQAVIAALGWVVPWLCPWPGCGEFNEHGAPQTYVNSHMEGHE